MQLDLETDNRTFDELSAYERNCMVAQKQGYLVSASHIVRQVGDISPISIDRDDKIIISMKVIAESNVEEWINQLKLFAEFRNGPASKYRDDYYYRIEFLD